MIIQSSSFRNLPKVNGHNMWAKYYDSSSSGSRDILFTRFHRLTMGKSKKGHNSRKTILTEKKKIRVRLFFMLIPHIKFQDPIFNRSRPYASVTDRPTQPATDRPKTICPLNFFEVLGIKKQCWEIQLSGIVQKTH